MRFLSLPAIPLLLIALSCATPPRWSPANQVDVYGRDSSPYTVETVKDLRKLGVPFRFHQVDRDPRANREMWRHVKKVRPELTRVLFPVVRVNGRLMFAPGTDQITERLKVLPPEK